MYITKQKSKKTIITITIAVAIIGLFAGYFFIFKGVIFGWSPIKNSSNNLVNYNSPTDDQTKSGDIIKNNSATNSDSGSAPNSVGSDRPEAPVVKLGDSKGTVNVTISAANQNDGTLQVRTLISAIANNGTCTLILSKDGATITRTAGVQSLPSSSTCKGFDIPESELTPGTWTAKLLFENETIKGEATRNITVL